MEWPAHPPLVGGGGVSLYLELFPIKVFYLFCDGAPFIPFNVNPLLENGGDARRASVRLDKPKSM